MRSIDGEVAVATAGVSAVINFMIGAVFDIPPATVFVVFMGAFIGLVFRPSIEVPGSGKEKLILFIKTCIYLISITILVSWIVPWVVSVLPGVAQKTIAGILGFICMLKRELISDATDFVIGMFSRKVK